MKFLKGLLVAAMTFTLAACATKVEKAEPIKVLAPLGAPSVSLLGLVENENVTLDTVDGPNVLSAELTKEDSDYDMIIAPINLGAGMIVKGKSQYVLDSVVTWGNLYIVGTDESSLTEEGTFAAFGEKSVPQKILISSMDVKLLKPEITYFTSANEVQQQLISKKSNVGLLAEPAVTATIAKAKEKGVELKIIKDLQKEYQIKNNTDSVGYPQAALFVKKGCEDKVKPYIEEASKFVNETALKEEAAIEKTIEKITPEKLGVPNSKIVKKTWERQNIKYVKANEVKDEISLFLKQFNLTLKDDAYSK